MKKGFVNSIGFKLIVLLIVIFTTLISASLIFNSQIDKLKVQIDNIYFGNFIPMLKLQNVVNNYRDLIFCIKKREFDCSIKDHENAIIKNWNYYNSGFKTDTERMVVNSINDEIYSSLKVKRLKNLYSAISKVDFLINYETDGAEKQRKKFLYKYTQMKDYLLYNMIAIIVFSFAIILYIFFQIFKKDNQLTILNKQYKIDSITDGMTKLYNRTYFDTLFDNLPFISNANKWQCAFIMFDIDFFKQYNDTYGHDMGDKTLIAVADVLKKYFNKEYEYVFRLGGEEFGVLLFDTNSEILEHCLQDINKKIVDLQIEHKNSEALDVVTISIGAIIYLPNSYVSANKLYKIADENLYKSKHSGRNKYTL